MNYVHVLPAAEPYCIINWQRGGENVSKTVCYSPDEAVQATNRHYIKGDFYNRYDHFEVERIRGIDQEEITA